MIKNFGKFVPAGWLSNADMQYSIVRYYSANFRSVSNIQRELFESACEALASYPLKVQFFQNPEANSFKSIKIGLRSNEGETGIVGSEISSPMPIGGYCGILMPKSEEAGSPYSQMEGCATSLNMVFGLAQILFSGRLFLDYIGASNTWHRKDHGTLAWSNTVSAQAEMDYLYTLEEEVREQAVQRLTADADEELKRRFELSLAFIGRSTTDEQHSLLVNLWIALEIATRGPKGLNRRIMSYEKARLRWAVEQLKILRSARDRLVHNGLSAVVTGIQVRLLTACILDAFLEEVALSSTALRTFLKVGPPSDETPIS